MVNILIQNVESTMKDFTEMMILSLYLWPLYICPLKKKDISLKYPCLMDNNSVASRDDGMCNKIRIKMVNVIYLCLIIL